MQDDSKTSPDPAEAIFEAALQLPAAERAPYLQKSCGTDAALRRRVENLLSAHEAAGEFLDSPAVPQLQKTEHTLPPEEKTGDKLGRYKLLQKIGEGGCGVVYMAEQEEPVRRRVALKVIKLGMDTKQVIARFEAERQALAMMDHPNIAKVLDAGATETGRPLFRDGTGARHHITDYCDQNNLSTRRTARAFHPGLPGHPARASKGNHPSRHQALEHPGHAARRRAGAESDRFRHRQSHAGSG